MKQGEAEKILQIFNPQFFISILYWANFPNKLLLQHIFSISYIFR